MIYTHIKNPLPYLVYIFCLQQFWCIFEQLMNVNYIHAEPGFIFFLQNTADRDQPAPYLIRIHTVLSLVVNTYSLITDTNLGEIQ